MIIADIGSGTGISAELFLEQGYTVLGIEPNREMRERSVALLKTFPNFTAIDGAAEATTLPSSNVDVIIAGQAFHWFDPEKTRAEFDRIVKPGGYVVLMWNERLVASAFEKAYEQFIIAHGNQYQQVDHRNIDTPSIERFFAPQQVLLKEFPNQQVFDLAGLEGRLLSSSYMPSKSEAGYQSMISDLQILFDRFQKDDRVTIHYTTKAYTARL